MAATAGFCQNGSAAKVALAPNGVGDRMAPGKARLAGDTVVCAVCFVCFVCFLRFVRFVRFGRLVRFGRFVRLRAKGSHVFSTTSSKVKINYIVRRLAHRPVMSLDRPS